MERSNVQEENEHLFNPDYVPAGVELFTGALMRPLFKEDLVGILLEYIFHPEDVDTGADISASSTSSSDGYSVSSSNFTNVGSHYWAARIIAVKGYFVQLRFESIHEDCSHDFWTPLISSKIHPVGYCQINRKDILPWKPSYCDVGPNHSDLKFLFLRYSALPRTIPFMLCRRLQRSLSSLKIDRLVLSPHSQMIFETGMHVEIRDSDSLHMYCVGKITNIVGTRIQVKYTTESGREKSVWYDKESPSIQPEGWCTTAGADHYIFSNKNQYSDVQLQTAGSPYQNFDDGGLCVGQMLEVIYPLDRDKFYVAQVEEILTFGYFMVRVIRGEAINGPRNNAFCVHVSSEEIFSFGFAQRNKIPLEKCIMKKPFSTVPADLLEKHKPREALSRRFAKHMKLEAPDWVNTHLMCPATILRAVYAEGRELLKIRYDGYGPKFDQWVAASSCEIYPVGYSELIGYDLESPGDESFVIQPPDEPYIPDLTSGQCPNVREFLLELNPSDWSPQDVQKFLRLNRLERFVDPCKKLNGSQLLTLEKEKIKEMMVGTAIGVDGGSIKLMIKTINHLRTILFASQLREYISQ